MTSHSLYPLFHPRSVAVVGASRDPLAIGHKVVKELLGSGFRGSVFPINPKSTEIASLKAFPSIAAVPSQIDLAVIAVPRDKVFGVVEECASHGIKALIVISAGFAEAGEKGRKMQNLLLEKVRQAGMRLIGPNCLGVINTDPEVRMNASFSPSFPLSGPVAMASQSGAIGLSILRLSRMFEVGLSSFVSTGNKADVSGNDLIEFWEKDPATSVILLYLESLGNPRRFAQIARRAGQTKPIVVIKSGKTSAGIRAAGSHTAALAAPETAVEALFRQSGVVRVGTLEEMFDVASCLSHQPLPEGPNVAVITNAGGPAILLTDACEAEGLVVREFSKAVQDKLADFLPSAASLKNPVDMIASASSSNYRRAVETVLTANEVDALVVLYTVLYHEVPQEILTAIGEGIRAGRRNVLVKKPILFCLMSEAPSRAPLEAGEEKIPTYLFPEEPAKVLGDLYRHAKWRKQSVEYRKDLCESDISKARRICLDRIRTHGKGWLSIDDTYDVLSTIKAPVAKHRVATSPDDAAVFSEVLGFPVVMKLVSESITHKTDVGGVVLRVSSCDNARRAYETIKANLAGRENEMLGVLIQPMIQEGIELMLGMTRDPQFGPLLAFGLGGIFVEVLSDVSFGLTPLSVQDAEEMIRSIRGYRILKGFRGKQGSDEDALRELLLRLSQLSEEVPEIASFDLNPVFALSPGKGCLIADARIQVSR